MIIKEKNICYNRIAQIVHCMDILFFSLVSGYAMASVIEKNKKKKMLAVTNTVRWKVQHLEEQGKAVFIFFIYTKFPGIERYFS